MSPYTRLDCSAGLFSFRYGRNKLSYCPISSLLLKIRFCQKSVLLIIGVKISSQDSRVRDACDRPTAGTSRVTRQGWVHGAEGAVSPHPPPAWKAAVWAYPPYAADHSSRLVDSKRHGDCG